MPHVSLEQGTVVTHYAPLWIVVEPSTTRYRSSIRVGTGWGAHDDRRGDLDGV